MADWGFRYDPFLHKLRIQKILIDLLISSGDMQSSIKLSRLHWFIVDHSRIGIFQGPDNAKGFHKALIFIEFNNVKAFKC